MLQLNRGYFCFLISFCFCIFGVKAQQGSFKNYSVDAGLAQSQVYAITQTTDGYLWLGTRGGGLCRFDGETFTTFTKKEGLPSNYINALYQCKNGTLWIGSSDGLSSYANGEFTNLELSENEERLIVSAILEDDFGNLWVGTNEGLYLIKDSIVVKKKLNKTKKPKYSEEITCLLKGDSSDLWIGTNRGLIHLINDSSTIYSRKNGLSSDYIHSLAFDNNRNLFIGTYGRGIAVLAKGAIEVPNDLKILSKSIVYDLLNDKQGNIWIATLEQGLVQWNGSDSTINYFTEKDGLANNHVRCIYQDSWSNLWIGTSGGGVSKFYGQYFDHYNSSSIGIKSNYIYAVNAKNDSDIWISTSGLGIDRYLNGGIHHYGTDSGFVDDKVKVIFQSKDSTIWLGTEGSGLFTFKKDSFFSFKNSTNINANWVKDIKEDLKGNVWIATTGSGLVKVERKQGGNDYSFQKFNLNNGLKSNRINVIQIDSLNRIWFAYQKGGVAYLVEDSVGKSVSNEFLESIVVRSMLISKNGDLWMGTAGNGVFKTPLYSDTIVTYHFSGEHSLSSDNIYLLGLDNGYNLWIGSEKGVDKVKLNSEGAPLEFTHFDVEKGFKGMETSRNAISVDENGRVWIGTINGLFCYNETFNKKNEKPPVLEIVDVSLFYNSIKKTRYRQYIDSVRKNGQGVIELSHSQNHITFDFKGALLTQPNKVKYKWRLKGYEKNWSPVSSKSSITYSNLSAGKYSFQVLSCNEDGIWNSTPVVVNFKIYAPFWKEWWFLIFISLLFLLVSSVFVRFRVNSIREKAKIEQNRLKMEGELVVLEQKALLLQMNPHFIFNCLNSIQGMIVQQDHKTARYFLAKFSKLMRQTLDNSRSSLILLDDEIVNLENYLSIEKISNEHHFEYEIVIDENLVTDFVQIPPMLIQPFVENAIIHGVRHKKGEGKVKVVFELQSNCLVCYVIDNGIGREKALALNENRDGTHKSTALIVTQERLRLLNSGSQSSFLEINDLVDEKGNPSGTEVKIVIEIQD